MVFSFCRVAALIQEPPMYSYLVLVHTTRVCSGLDAQAARVDCFQNADEAVFLRGYFVESINEDETSWPKS